MQLKGTDKDVRTIGRELGVRYVLEGGVRKAGDQLRITAQLIDATLDEQIWGHRYSRTMDEVFEVQEQVAREIVSALDVTLTKDEDRRLSEHPIADVRAFEFYLQARQEIRRYGPALERGMMLVRRAMEIEGSTPPLRGLEALGSIKRLRSGAARDLSVLDDVEATGRDLIEHAPSCGHGHGLLALVSYERGDTVSAVKHFLAALEGDPTHVDWMFFLGVTYSGAGLDEDAIGVSQRLLECDPLSPTAWILHTAVNWFVGKPRDGLVSGHRALELDPGHTMGRWLTGYTHLMVGQVPEARRHAEILVDTAPEMLFTHQLMGLVEAIERNPMKAIAHVEAVVGADDHHRFHLAEVFAVAGDHDRAFELLEKSVNSFHPVGFIREYCPFLEALRGTPRFEAYAARAGDLATAFAREVADAPPAG